MRILFIGQIDYANCTPIFAALKTSFDCTGYTFVHGVPSALNEMLSEGKVDVCPSSSIEYGKRWQKYLLLPDISISSIGPVKSVCLFSKLTIEELEDKVVALTTESDTSVNLLRIILAKKYGLKRIRFERTAKPLPQALETSSAVLLIGDAALKAAASNHGCFVYDLGQLWYELTGVPFVFALWIVRRDAVARSLEMMNELSATLLKAKKLAYESYGVIAAHCRERDWLSEAELVDYWRTISYDLSPAHLEGLKIFYRYALEMGLLTQLPEIEMFSPSTA